MSRIVLAMSGGVDSSVAAHLLVEQGHEVIGVFMRHGEESIGVCAVGDAPSPLLKVVDPRADHKQGCCSASDAADARRVADRLDIPFYALNLQSEFREIIDYFVDEYTRGRTPNPCVVCNHWIKFGKLFDYADSVGAEYVATGHYAQLLPSEDGPALVMGADRGKDQSYVLFGIDRSLFDRMILPVGSYHKPEIRRRATELGLRVADKKDSQEICFVTSGQHHQFVRERDSSAGQPGEIVTADGRRVGGHDGIERFTIGQRKGLGIAMGEPHFVVDIDAETRRVMIGTKSELARSRLSAERCNWLVENLPDPFICQAKIRYNSRPVPAVARRPSDDRLEIAFDEPVYGVAPGQAIVCYDGDRVLGGGWIRSSD